MARPGGYEGRQQERSRTMKMKPESTRNCPSSTPRPEWTGALWLGNDYNEHELQAQIDAIREELGK